LWNNDTHERRSNTRTAADLAHRGHARLGDASLPHHLSAGADSSGHSHPVVGIGYVLEGTIISAFDNDPEETFTAGQSFKDRASLHRVSRNGSQTEPMIFLIAYTVRVGEPNTTWPQPQAHSS